MAVFNYCPTSIVVTPIISERPEQGGISMGGYVFSARPTTPYVDTYRAVLSGLRWFVTGVGATIDATTSPTINAAHLWAFYKEHELWKPFDWSPPNWPAGQFKFKEAFELQPAVPGSNGYLPALELTLVRHNPGF